MVGYLVIYEVISKGGGGGDGVGLRGEGPVIMSKLNKK